MSNDKGKGQQRRDKKRQRRAQRRKNQRDREREQERDRFSKHTHTASCGCEVDYTLELTPEAIKRGITADGMNEMLKANGILDAAATGELTEESLDV